ncbi:MAG: SusC/RagA family TonB-linked outer membrane protein [Bacteroidales bacterium]|nr:SusC/RagA family TonB-linked outer membrane protein [Bacteroidales bacterium]MBR1489424.1 SusC/RagA family TonB-linked outer membrane protein [Bacteroidales bacterium]
MRKTQKLLAVFSLLSILLLGGLPAFAQNRCTGTVTDAQGEPVIAASVLIKGAPISTGVVTDVDGHFVQPNAKVGDVLVLSCIGYATTEVTWNGQPLTVVMADDQNLLEETVVTAYGGRTLRSKLTNSVSSVKNETIASGMHNQAAASLAGAVAGLSVRQVSGDPTDEPTIVLRGGTGIDGTGSPLVIVDGAQRSMSDINPNDIESIEVMKDAGATAIYGARAANGVILVTTKRGTEGTSSINFHIKHSYNYLNSPYEILDSEDYLYWMRTATWRGGHIVQDAKGKWYGYGAANVSTLNGVQGYGTGNRYFDNNGNVYDGRVSNLGSWGVYAVDENGVDAYGNDLSFLLHSSDWGMMRDPIADLAKTDPAYNYAGRGNLLFWKGTDTKDINIKSPAPSRDYSVDFQGGNNKGRYYASLGYNSTEGSAVDNDYTRLTFVLNGDYKIRDWLHSSSSFNYSRTNQTPILNGNYAYNYFARAWFLPPTMRVYNAYGEFNPSPRNSVTDSHVGIINAARDYQYLQNKFTMSQVFTIYFTPWLNLKLNGSWYYLDAFYESFTRDYLYGPGRTTTTRISQNQYDNQLRQTYNAILNFNKTFGTYHNTSAMLGFEFVDDWSFGFSASGRNAPTDEFQDLNLTRIADDDGNPVAERTIDSYHNGNRVMSGFGKIDYDYDSKYLLSAVFRYDGYSRLAKENRWGFFPGISAGWVFSKEPFMAATRDVISFAKLRASYGANGVLASSIGNYTVQGAYGTTTKYNGGNANVLSTLPNASLLWEKSWTSEGGLDISFFQNRLNLNITGYNRIVSDKIASITTPSHSGISSFTSNNGTIRNRGLELEMSAKLVDTRDFKSNFRLTAAYNVNKVIKLPDNGLERNRQSATQVYVPGSFNPETGESEMMWVGGYQEGQTPGDLYGFLAEGVFTQADLDSGKYDYWKDQSTTSTFGVSAPPVLYGPKAWAELTANGMPVNSSGNLTALPIQPGDVKWKDVNGDGIIDDYDKVKLGNTVPKWTGGFVLDFSWKGLTLSGRFDYALDYKITDLASPQIMGAAQGTFNTIANVADMYDPATGTGKNMYGMYVWADQLGKRNICRAWSSIFTYEGSYLCAREVTLSYAIPQSVLKHVKIDRANVFVTGQNLGYLTKAGMLGSPEYGANYWGVYTLPRVFMFGANITF